MEGLYSIVDYPNYNHCVYRQGFVFTSITKPANVLDAIVIRNPSTCQCWTPKKSWSEHTLEEHIAFVNKYKLEKAMIIADDIEFITRCPSLKYLEIVPADSAMDEFDYSPLYKMPVIEFLSCKTMYGGNREHKKTSIDYSKIKNLKELKVDGCSHLHYGNISTIKELYVFRDKQHEDIIHINNNYLKKLTVGLCSFRSLHGMQNMYQLEWLCLENCRKLQDVEAILACSTTLKALSISNCPRISDFSWLSKLKELEHLCLIGSNELCDLNFLNHMPVLKTFSLAMSIQSCDLTPCMRIPHVDLLKGKRTYNLRDRDLPKNIVYSNSR